MDPIGLLLSLPTDSIAVRVALASLSGVLLARLLFRADLRSGRARTALAVLPGAAIAVVVLAFAGDPALPSLWHTVDGGGGLSIPVRDTYLQFSPAAVPVLVGAWAAVAALRVGGRALRGARLGRTLRRLAEVGGAAPPAVASLVERIAVALRVPAPALLVVPDLPGGAAVLGVRRPLLLVDRTLLATLDRAELEGVLAHELAHVQRRDNLVAATLGVLRDVFFFVPGGGWSLRRLLREREHAADQAAVELTGRPGALASGLLKVLEGAGRRTAVTCAPLLSEGTLVERVEQLCDERPPATARRRVAEGTVPVLALAGAVAIAVWVPQGIAGEARERDALGLLLSDVRPAVGGAVPAGRPTVFRAFDGATTTTQPASPASSGATLLDDPDAVTPRGLAACDAALATCSVDRPDVHLPLRPEPILRVDGDEVERWQLDPVLRTDNEQHGFFWFHRLPEAG